MATQTQGSETYIGLMSGTSMDGIDGVLADLSTPGKIRTLAAVSLPMPPALRDAFLALNIPGHNELDRAARAAQDLAQIYAQATTSLCRAASVRPEHIRAIGAHGQTVRHAPESGYSIQLNAPAALAEQTGIAVVADFRARDIAAGGQGAPLVPAFHAAWFGCAIPRVILNLGGIANVTVLGQDVLGFDTGPANMLMDLWAQQHTGHAYDRNGQWAAQGQCQTALLEQMLADPWFERPPPKSTGRDQFNAQWLDKQLSRAPGTRTLAPADVMATLLALTTHSIAQAVRKHAAQAHEVLACGGGAENTYLMHELAQVLPCPLATTQREGMPVQMVEALAFAWLAHAHIHGRSAALPAVTGAQHPSIAGCLYPA
ncbi:anhydro-N-acetylmuramic acid kinase [Alcaligenaceae bacterium CGII-47]|nr:anhydro-N-acetylmuramic acid kinase [Alcaligenaceae bacterium CGII-47]